MVSVRTAGVTRKMIRRTYDRNSSSSESGGVVGCGLSCEAFGGADGGSDAPRSDKAVDAPSGSADVLAAAALTVVMVGVSTAVAPGDASADPPNGSLAAAAEALGAAVAVVSPPTTAAGKSVPSIPAGGGPVGRAGRGEARGPSVDAGVACISVLMLRGAPTKRGERCGEGRYAGWKGGGGRVAVALESCQCWRRGGEGGRRKTQFL